MALTRRSSRAAGLTLAALLAGGLGLGGAPAQAQAPAPSPPTISAFFAQGSALPGDDVGLSFTIVNSDPATALTGVAFSVTLPAGLAVSTPSQLDGTCGGTATADAGTATISLADGALDPDSSCVVLLDVVATGTGTRDVTSGPVAATESGPGAPSNTTTLTLLQPPTVAAAFSAPAIPVGGTSTLTYTLGNPNGADRFYNAAFTDALPTGLAVATPAGVTGTCVTGGDAAVAAAPGDTTFSLLGLTLDPGASCTIAVDITATGPTTAPNATGPVTFAFDTGGGDFRGGSVPGASDTLVGIAPPTSTSAFGATAVAPGDGTTLTLTLANVNKTTTLTGVSFTDALPAGLVLATPSGLSGGCGGGTVGAADGASTITLTGASLPAGGQCSFTVGVRASTAGPKVTSTGPVSSAEGGSGAGAPATLNVASPPTVAVAFGAASVLAGSGTTATFTLGNPNAEQSLSGLRFDATLPAGLVVSPGAVSGACGGSIAATAGGSTVSLTGGSLAAAATCAVTVPVVATSAGDKTVTTGAPSADQSPAGTASSATLHVTAAPAPPAGGGGPTPPSTAFTVGRVTATRGGVVTFTILVPGPGTVDVLETIGRSVLLPRSVFTPGAGRAAFSRRTAPVARAGSVRLRLKPNARGLKALRRHHGRVRLNLWVRFTPRGYAAATGGRLHTAYRKVPLPR